MRPGAAKRVDQFRDGKSDEQLLIANRDFPKVSESGLSMFEMPLISA
jgi:hypothetical protein